MVRFEICREVSVFNNNALYTTEQYVSKIRRTTKRAIRRINSQLKGASHICKRDNTAMRVGVVKVGYINIEQNGILVEIKASEYEMRCILKPRELNNSNKDTTIGYFSINQLPGCCGAGVLNGMSVKYHFRNMGIGTVLNKLAIDMATLFNYGVLICTDVDTNKPQSRILDKIGWSGLYNFLNPKTHNSINIHAITLKRGGLFKWIM